MIAALLLALAPQGFESDFENTPDRIWVGPEYWANRLQDWRIHDGWLECVAPRFSMAARLRGGSGGANVTSPRFKTPRGTVTTAASATNTRPSLEVTLT